MAIGAVVLTTLLCSVSATAEAANPAAGSTILEPAVWQGPEINAPATTVSTVDSSQSGVNSLRLALQAAPPIPPQRIQVPTQGAPAPTKTPAGARAPSDPPRPSTSPTPLLDGNAPTEELMPPVVDGCIGGTSSDGPLHIQPYGGGHPTDWSWGCGGSPYREGPGMCDNWRIGPRWHITVDGIVMSREHTDLLALANQMVANDVNGTVSPAGFENFGEGPGGRVSFMSQVGRCVGWDLQAAYEGINNWNASIVFPKTTIDNVPLTIPPVPDTEPPAPFPQEFQQRSLHYRSNYNSGEINFYKYDNSDWRLFCGVRFMRIDDDINDFLNQDTQAPMAGPRTAIITPVGGTPPPTVVVNDPIGPTFETDRLNLYHMQNNLSGFQIGLLHDTLCLNDRFALEGFVNGGIYYNQAKYSNVMGVFTTQTFADNTRSVAVVDSRVDVSNIQNNDTREYAEVSYEAEASLTAVCRLNKCWALRAGYQVLWINHLHLADQAFLGDPGADSDLFFQGWHAGVECRR
jgi:hypothetical protein